MGDIIGFTEGDFRKNLLGVFKLYDTYISHNDVELYVERTKHLVGDWGAATEALQTAVFSNNSVPEPEDLARFANPRQAEARPEPRPHRAVYSEDPRQDIVDILRQGGFKGVYGELGRETKTRNGWVRGQCPIHKGKKQSFGYSLDTGIWKCHSRCGSGSLFDYEMAQTGESYAEVLARLAWELGVDLKPKNSGSSMTFMEE